MEKKSWIFTIHGDPRTKKNHSMMTLSGGYPRLIPSKAWQRYEKIAAWQVPSYGIRRKVNVCCRFYMKTDYDNAKARVDLVGLLQGIDDLLTERGCIEDDNSRIIGGHDGSRVLWDKLNPRTEITITEWE